PDILQRSNVFPPAGLPAWGQAFQNFASLFGTYATPSTLYGMKVLNRNATTVPLIQVINAVVIGNVPNQQFQLTLSQAITTTTNQYFTVRGVKGNLASGINGVRLIQSTGGASTVTVTMLGVTPPLGWTFGAPGTLQARQHVVAPYANLQPA